MAHITIPSADVDQGSVVDESLMSAKIKNNDDDHEARLIALEALSGGGGVAAAAVEDLFADVVAGGDDDVAKFWKVRHHVSMNTTGQGVPRDGLDFEQKEVYSRFFNDPNFTIVSAMNTNVQSYLSFYYAIEQNEQMQFRIKKGENFFCIGLGFIATGSATVFRVYVDGVNVNTYGLVDENDVVVTSSFSANNAATRYGKQFQFYGLDGEEHVVTIKNENATALEVSLAYVDVGFRSKDYAIDHTVHVKAGVANVGGIAADFNEGSYSFAKPQIGLANGHTGMLKINQAGTVTAVDGLSPAATQLKPQVAVTFSAGPVTSLAVKNHWYMPSNGICLFQHPNGSTFLFSYSSKAQSGGPASQTLDGIIWQRQPTEDFTPLPDPATLLVNTWRGDGRIEYWAKPPILIDGTNNKIDFRVTIDGVETTHAATVASGWYSADLIPLGAAVVNAMNVAKPLPTGHNYFCKYSTQSQLWTIGIEGDRIQEIDFLWATGANSGSSFGTVLGFSSDVLDATSYLSPLIKQHLAIRVFVADDALRSSEHPSMKYAVDAGLHTSAAEADSLLQSGGLVGYRRFDASGNRGFMVIYPDEDCCGMSIMFMREDIGTYVTYSIDDGDETYLVTTGRPNDGTSPTQGSLIHAFISFPKGSRKIILKAELNVWFEVEASTQFITFFGYRQFFTKPQWETLAPQEKVLKTFEVNPIRMFATAYGHNTALYSPQPSNDNINTLTESGTWAQITSTTLWNGRERQSTTVGGFIDVEFVLSGDGGGVGIRRFDSTDTSRRLAFYLAAGSITEGTDLVEFASTDWHAVHYKKDFQHLGLPAGTYTLRMKNLDTQRQINNAVIVYDTVLPQVGARTLSEVANTGQSVSWPIHTRSRESSRYQSFRQPSYYPEGSFKRGIVHHGDYLVAAHTFLLRDETIDVVEEADVFWLNQNLTNIGDYVGYRTFCRSISHLPRHFSTDTVAVQPALDGRNLNSVTMRQQAKGGFAPTSVRGDCSISVFNNLESAITHSAGLVFNMADTRGLRTGQKIILENGAGATEEAFVASVVTDTSFTISRALQVLSEAAVIKVYFWGFHNMTMTSVDASDFYPSAFVYEPLPIEESLLPIRVQTERREETLYTRPVIPAVTGVASVRVSARVPFPIHADGEEGTFFTTQWLDANGENIQYTPVSALHFNVWLRSIISATGVGTTARTFAIVSRKFIKAITDLRVRG